MTDESINGCQPDQHRHAMAQDCCDIQADVVRLTGLVNDAAERLLGSFREFAELEWQAQRCQEHRHRVESALSVAVTSLQFQDMVTQLSGQLVRRLEGLEGQLRNADGASVSSTVSICHGSVGQTGMNSGSIDLF
jgi:hypothetical protein